MARTKTPHQAKNKQNEAEIIKGGAGDWEIRNNGKFYNPLKRMWVKKCHTCKRSFYAKRVDAKTCSPACRKQASRQTLKQFCS